MRFSKIIFDKRLVRVLFKKHAVKFFKRLAAHFLSHLYVLSHLKSLSHFFQAILEILISFIYYENPNSQNLPTTQESIS